MSLSNKSTNDNIEFSSKEEIDEYQSFLLAKQLDYAKKKSPFYTKLFSKIGTTKFSDIPFTVKSDLSINNDSFLAIEKEDIAEKSERWGTSISKDFLKEYEKKIRTQLVADFSNDYNLI